MIYGDIKEFQTGVAIPISGIKTQNSCGIGEFFDLVPFAKWAQTTGMNLIQILPVNDSGSGSSPYSALSAFALNPIYLHLDALEGASSFLNEIRVFRESQRHLARIPYYEIYSFKQSIFQKIFANLSSEKTKLLTPWIKKNSWVKPYALFLFLKNQNGGKAWYEWSEFRSIDSATIESLFKKHRKDLLYFVWLQYECEIQFSQSLVQINELNIKLKGDIPILINEDSVDVWAYPEFFDKSAKAGAPPDMFSKTGQNWGFPCYNWDALEKEDFKWWKERMQQCAKFFHAIRIDHVLGFFRIWQVPSNETSGILGSFYPANTLSVHTLKNSGFDNFTLEQMFTPSFTHQQVMEHLGGIEFNWDLFLEFKGDLFFLKESIQNESAVKQLAGSNKVLEQALLNMYWNRVLITNKDEIHPYWYWYQSPTFNRLSQEQKQSITYLVHNLEASQDELWSQKGAKLLKILKESSDMLVCAEDLGAVPPCVPIVLADLDILSLKIERWARDWNSPGQPFLDPKQYTRLSVCSPSCHDTTTLRGWWDEKGEELKDFLPLLGWTQAPDFLTKELAEAIIRRNLDSNSALCIFPLQDWLSLSYDIRTYGSDEERINIPGTVTDFNWNWKMKLSVEELLENNTINQKIFTLILERKHKSL